MSKNENEELILPMFHLEEKFPNAKSIFSTATPPVEEIKDEALIIPDTNILLIPYDIQPKSLDDIKTTYELLINQNRLFIPAQVAREFVKNRGEKIKNLFNSLTQKQNFNLNKTNYRLLESFDDYNDLLKIENEINSKINDYRKKLKSVLDHIRSWRWNDPVSNLYRGLFKSEIIVEAEISKENLEKDLKLRLSNRIPPGFKDSGKDDKGIGDVIIWNTILELGQQYKKPIIFVTGEEKTDWMLRSNSEALYPNFELVEEYARASDGKSFHILKFSELLDLFGAEEEVVADVKNEELEIKHASYYERAEREHFYIKAENAAYNWIINTFEISNIEVLGRSFIDFIVELKGGKRIGIIVKAVMTTNSIPSKLKTWRNEALNSIHRIGVDDCVLMIVSNDSQKIDHYFNYILNDNFTHIENVEMILGYLDGINNLTVIFDNFASKYRDILK